VEIILNKEKLDITVDRDAMGLGLNPWGILQRVWRETGKQSQTFMINFGGIINANIPAVFKNDLKVAFEYVRRVHANIPDKPTGSLALHGAHNDLQKVVFTTK